MKPIELSNRLKALTHYVSPYQFIVDVGTDHCFVPIYLVQNGMVERAIATDLRDGPVEDAKKNVQKYGLEDQIDVRQGDGLQSLTLNDPFEVIIIAGMGGILITDILEASKDLLKNVKRFVLQPNKKAPEVRKWLMENGFQIIEEEMVLDEGIYYEIIVSEKIEEGLSYTEEELQYGPVLLQKRDDTFIQFWEKQCEQLKQILSNLPEGHERTKELTDSLKSIQRVLER